MSLLLSVNRIVRGAEVCYNELVPCEIIGYIRGADVSCAQGTNSSRAQSAETSCVHDMSGNWWGSGIVDVADFISGVEQGKDRVNFCESIIMVRCSTLDRNLPTRSFIIGMIHCQNMIRNVGKGWFSRKADRCEKLALSPLMAPGRDDDKRWGAIGS